MKIIFVIILAILGIIISVYLLNRLKNEKDCNCD